MDDEDIPITDIQNKASTLETPPQKNEKDFEKENVVSEDKELVQPDVKDDIETKDK